MRTLALALVLVFSYSLSAQSWWGSRKTVRGTGEVTVQQRDVTDFRGIEACCNFEVVIRRGNYAVSVEAQRNLHEYIRAEVVGGRLELGFVEGVNLKTSDDIRVEVTLPELEYLGASSNASVRTEDEFDGRELSIDASSGARVMARYNGERSRADVSSGAKIEVAGAADEVRYNASSGGRIDAGRLTARTVRADVSSGANIRVNAEDKLRANASSGGGIRYSGAVTDVDADASSGGSVRRQ